MKPKHDLAHSTGTLPRARDAHRERDGRVARRVGAHDLEQLHDVGRREEVHADDARRVGDGRADLVDREHRRVGRERRGRRAHGVEPREELLLERHALEDRLDHELALRERAELGRALEPRELRAERRLRQPPAAERRRAPVARRDAPARGRGRVRARLDERDGHARVDEGLRDARAHRAAADDPDARDRARGRPASSATPGGLRRRALGEEHVLQPVRLRRPEELAEQPRLLRAARREARRGRGRERGLDDARRRDEPARARGRVRARRRALSSAAGSAPGGTARALTRRAGRAARARARARSARTRRPRPRARRRRAPRRARRRPRRARRARAPRPRRPCARSP